ncbi:hypothetical protein JTB14_024143 [Gonioctena quinquepunctata]|nr:hypothetical protein JTB14_024143 [Gonioctena quinquepunctata]
MELKVWDACVLLVMTHDTEIETVTQSCLSRLEICQEAIEWKMRGVSLRNRMRNEEIRRTKVKDVTEQFARNRRLAGHLARDDAK